jgi:hypothetical protein
MKVEVELEDLETIVFATAAIKQIENALSGRKNDPFVRPYLQYSEAHSNLTTAMTHAKRSKEAYATPWNGELSEEEITYLQSLDAFDRNKERRNSLNPDGYDKVSGDQRIKHQEIDSLLAKGCIKMGTLCYGVLWSGESQPSLRQTPEFATMITPRGRTKLEEVLMKRAEDAKLFSEVLDQAGL